VAEICPCWPCARVVCNSLDFRRTFPKESGEDGHGKMYKSPLLPPYTTVARVPGLDQQKSSRVHPYFLKVQVLRSLEGNYI